MEAGDKRMVEAGEARNRGQVELGPLDLDRGPPEAELCHETKT